MASDSPDQTIDRGGDPAADGGATAPDQPASLFARYPDLSAWLVWAGLMLVAIAILPFAVRNHDVVRAIARMCGFDID